MNNISKRIVYSDSNPFQYDTGRRYQRQFWIWNKEILLGYLGKFTPKVTCKVLLFTLKILSALDWQHYYKNCLC